MVPSQLALHHLSFAYEGSPLDVFDDLSVQFPAGWSGIVGANGAGKTTLLQLATGVLAPAAGHVRAPGPAVYCPQRTDEMPQDLAALLADPTAAGRRLCRGLGVEPGWPSRWGTLSHGERKRAQLAVALWHDPVVLALDEPTNHLDAAAAAQIAGALRAFTGVGLLVSHDRTLLDELCSQCLFLSSGGAVLRPGGYSAGAAQQRLEEVAAQRERERADAELRRLRRQQQARRRQADRAQARRAGRRIPRKDSDARDKRQLAILSGKDARAGRLLAQMRRRVERAQTAAAAVEVEKHGSLGIWVPGARSRRDTVAALGAGRLPLGEARMLVLPALAVGPSDRIALTGDNGSGKSTLVRELLAHSGLPPERLVYLPQELTAGEARRLLEEVGASADEVLGRTLAVFSRLGSKPERLLESRLPSPGETRKLLLALGVAREPHLIVMDEPTNHLDLPAIEALEEALADCPCALLVVSHDRRFIERLCRIEWHLAAEGRGRVGLTTGVLTAD